MTACDGVWQAVPVLEQGPRKHALRRLIAVLAREISLGPSTDPYGTPYARVSGSGVATFTDTFCSLFVRYEDIRSSAVPVSPMSVSRWHNRMLWCMVSNADDISSITK